MPKFSVDEVVRQILESDAEDLDDDDYDSSDLEWENDSTVTQGGIQTTIAHAAPAPIVPRTDTTRGQCMGQLRCCGRGRGMGRGFNFNPALSHGSQNVHTWKKDTSSFVEGVFTPRENPGPKNIPIEISVDSTPLDYLNLFWDDSLWKLIVDETNRNALRVISGNLNNYAAKSIVRKPITSSELKAFMGLRISMEMLVHKDKYAHYWRSKDSSITNTPGFAEIMTRDRFLAIWQLLHCVDEDDPTLDKTDKIYKTRPILDYLLEKFKYHYDPYCELSLDEGMIPTKNRLSFKQYIKDKPIRWGIKTYLVCDSANGYVCNAEVYTGKKSDSNEIANLGVTGNLVVRMCEEFSGQNYTIYTDIFYTSVQLVEYLLKHKSIRMCGTAMTNRREFPKAIIRKQNEMKRGEWDILFDGNVAVIVWRDKKPIYFVTSVYVSSPPEHVHRYDATEKRKVPVPCPKSVKAYNAYMGGTDKNDQMTRLQKCRRHYKWPRRLVIKFFMWAAFNAYILMGFVKPHDQPNKRTFTFHLFIEQLCNELVADSRSMGTFGSRRFADCSDNNRLIVDAHHDAERAENASSNNRCVVCREKYLRAKKRDPTATDNDLPKRCKTVYRCTFCKEFLCIGKPGNNCWFDWHHKQDYWR